MIKTEVIDEKYIKTWSDQGMYIYGGQPIGLYAEATDPINSGRTYIETDEPIEEITEEEYAEAGRILLGDDTENTRVDYDD